MHLMLCLTLFLVSECIARRWLEALLAVLCVSFMHDEICLERFAAAHFEMQYYCVKTIVFTCNKALDQCQYDALSKCA
jgi:hypothetical protein